MAHHRSHGRTRTRAARSDISICVVRMAAHPAIRTNALVTAEEMKPRSCVTSMIVRRSLRRRSKSSTSRSAAASRLAVGSSSISISGCVVSARAISTRWRCPPERSAKRRDSRWGSATASSATHLLRTGRPVRGASAYAPDTPCTTSATVTGNGRHTGSPGGRNLPGEPLAVVARQQPDSSVSGRSSPSINLSAWSSATVGLIPPKSPRGMTKLASSITRPPL